MRPLLPVDEALRRVIGAAWTLEAESVPYEEGLGRVLQEVLLARQDYPAFDKSLMDGYAVVASDLDPIPRTLHVDQEIAAGADPGGLRAVASGTAARIMTGAPIPQGADAVLVVEETEAVAGEPGSVRALAPVRRACDKHRSIAYSHCPGMKGQAAAEPSQ